MIAIQAYRGASKTYRDDVFGADRKVEVVEWSNGKGYSIWVGPVLGADTQERIDLSHADYDALVGAIDRLRDTAPPGDDD